MSDESTELFVGIGQDKLPIQMIDGSSFSLRVIDVRVFGESARLEMSADGDPVTRSGALRKLSGSPFTLRALTGYRLQFHIAAPSGLPDGLGAVIGLTDEAKQLGFIAQEVPYKRGEMWLTVLTMRHITVHAGYPLGVLRLIEAGQDIAVERDAKVIVSNNDSEEQTGPEEPEVMFDDDEEKQA